MNIGTNLRLTALHALQRGLVSPDSWAVRTPTLKFAVLHPRADKPPCPSILLRNRFLPAFSIGTSAARKQTSVAISSFSSLNFSTAKMELTGPFNPSKIPLQGLPHAATMRFDVQPYSALGELSYDCVASGVLCDEKGNAVVHPTVMNIDTANCDGALQLHLQRSDFKGKLGTSLVVRLGSKCKVGIACLLGFGCTKSLKGTNIRKVSGELAGLLKSAKCVSAALVIPDGISPRNIQCLMESLLLSLATDKRFKSDTGNATNCQEDSVVRLTNLTIFVENTNMEEVKKAVECSRSVADGVYFAYELVSAPPNYCTTVTLCEAAVAMAKQFNLKAKVLTGEEIEAQNMGLLYGVARGSQNPPRFVHLTYSPDSPVIKKYAFVGKAICFDSGGYNIKSAAGNIELMKFDMGGAAAIIGAAMTIAKMKPQGVEVHFIFAAAENMVSANAYRPGDILTASNGKTVEVGNTDAEGRLTLGDSLVYAEKLGVDGIVDIATLTGACMVALGLKYAGVFGSTPQHAIDIVDCAAASGELMWPLPLAEEYREQLDSSIADMNNVGGNGKGGAILAALFLKDFVKTTPWAHIDIAGPAFDWTLKKSTGFGVRTLVEYIMSQSRGI